MTTLDNSVQNQQQVRTVGPDEEAGEQQASAGEAGSALQISARDHLPVLIGVGTILAGAFLWAYWPILAKIVRAWERQPDYSHGYFVVPLAIFFLWARRDRFPGVASGFAWPGLVMIALSIGVRVSAALFYIDAVDGWSILLWAGGAVWPLGGWRVFRWSLPSVLFLWFMIPLPFKAERILSFPLQTVATKLSCWVLQFLGQPALAEGHTILIGENRLEVAQACSGLRIFVGIAALAFAYVVLVRRPLWEKAMLLVSIVPIALIANSSRIVVTGLLQQIWSDEAAQTFSHDVAGYVMIPFAALLCALVLWFLGRLTSEVELLDVREVMHLGSDEPY